MDSDSMFFNDYCIVCDRAIIPPKQPEPVLPKKKVAAGAIRIKNADGTVTTRTATGQKTTRPPLRRGPNSANRLAAVAAANNTTAAAKFQPLTRSKTAEAGASHCGETSSSPESAAIRTPAPAETPFLSSIYCSKACAQVEACRSTDFARRISHDYSSPSLHLVTSGLPFSGGSPAPPSPLYISESDSSSNPDAGPRSAEPGASSAPNALSFFNMHRDNADDAWRDVNKQRRSSIHPSFRPVGMARQPSQASTTYSIPGQSSDSLNSLWTGNDQDINLGRSTSGSGRIRMTPMTEAATQVPNVNNAGRRSMSTSSERAPAVPARPLPRSSLSQVSLTATSTEQSAPIFIPPEFGSAPEHTLNLWNSYHNSFSQRDASGTSSNSRGGGYQLPFAGYTPTGAAARSPQNAFPGSVRRTSHSSTNGNGHGCGGASLQRPVGGTIRAKSKTDVTWDSFGLDEVLAHKKRQERLSGVENIGQTPRQTIQIGQGGCRISYAPAQVGTSHSSRRASSSTRSHSSDEEEQNPEMHRQYSGALAIPKASRSGTSISPARTPTRMLPPSAIPSRPASTAPVAMTNQVGAIPDLAALRIGTGSCSPYLSDDNVTAIPASVGNSAPRSTWNWSKWEQEGGKTYTVPEGLKANANSGKTGLFFFK